MKKSVISFISGAMCMAVLSGGIVFAGGAWKTINVLENDITVVVDGKQISEQNFIYSDRTYLPLRAVAEAVGKEVTYDEKTNTAFIGSAPTPVQKITYYSGFSINIPDYTSVTGVPLKDKIVDEDDFMAIYWYEYTDDDDVIKYREALQAAGFVYLGVDDKEELFIFNHTKYKVMINLDSTVDGHSGDLEILIVKFK